MKNVFIPFILWAGGCISVTAQIRAQPSEASGPKIPDAVLRTGVLSVKDYGAKGDGKTDDTQAIQAACDLCIQNPQICSTVRFPVGNYRTSKPIILQNLKNGQYRFFTVRLLGDLSNKAGSNDYLSRITCDYKNGFGLGIQLGRSIEIKNLTILGKYSFPYSVNNQNIATLKFSDWLDPTITDSRNHPYAGIVIDPYSGVGGSGGSSDVSISHCAIKQWMVGICLSPNPQTLNDEMINILEDNIEACRVAIAIGQDQSKTVNIKGLKVWASVHTVLDGLNYGRGTGGGSVFCENWNIAGNVNQLFNLITDRFPLSARDIYSESLFKIGSVGCGTGSSFINFQIDFLSGPGMPAADYILLGCANFLGGMLRYYDGSRTHRLNLSNFRGMLRDMTLNNAPLTIGLYGMVKYPTPVFDNVYLYYSGTMLKTNADTLILSGISSQSLKVDRKKWTASLSSPNKVNPGDYILGSPRSTTRKYFDNPLISCNTIQIGRVVSVSGDRVELDDVGLNVVPGDSYDAIYISRLK
jgi:hypothetical protein